MSQSNTLQKAAIALLIILLAKTNAFGEAKSAADLVKEAIDHLRGETSYAESVMTVNREDYKRTSELKGWTKGTDYSLIRFTYPAKDAGNASLTNENKMWSFSPRTNRVVKIPPSMMGQSWMGSDLSYNDLSKSDDIVEDYQHSLIEEKEHEGKKVYVIQSIPFEDAPVVWGKEIIEIREDYIMLSHEFYDQDGELIKVMKAEEIKEINGKLYATKLRMTNLEEKDRWTELKYKTIRFGDELPQSIFTLSNLRNPRD